MIRDTSIGLHQVGSHRGHGIVISLVLFQQADYLESLGWTSIVL
jgi:hypothetical protein